MSCKDEWTTIKELMARAHCGKGAKLCIIDDDMKRRMVVAFIPADYGAYSTIFIALEGSPPKAYAIISFSSDAHDLKKLDIIYPDIIKILDAGLKHYKTFYPKISLPSCLPKKYYCLRQLSIKKLLSRDDVVIVNLNLQTHSVL